MTENKAGIELLNGIPSKSGSLLFDSSSRALRYGDGLFETIRVINGVPLFLNDHCHRLKAGITLLGLEPSEAFEPELLQVLINRILSLNDLRNARIRLTVYRAGGGLYFAESNQSCWHMSCVELESSEYSDNETGIKLGLFNQELKTSGRLSNIKSLNSLIYILAANFAMKMGFDDVLLFNTKGNILESVHSNLFIVSGNKLITPPLSDGCLEGVLRKNLLKSAAFAGWECVEVSVNTEMLKHADEILLTNVIRGVQWVNDLNGINYKRRTCSKLNAMLNESMETGSH